MVTLFLFLCSCFYYLMFMFLPFYHCKQLNFKISSFGLSEIYIIFLDSDLCFHSFYFTTLYCTCFFFFIETVRDMVLMYCMIVCSIFFLLIVYRKCSGTHQFLIYVNFCVCTVFLHSCFKNFSTRISLLHGMKVT